MMRIFLYSLLSLGYLWMILDFIRDIKRNRQAKKELEEFKRGLKKKYCPHVALSDENICYNCGEKR